jgi:hypothetical protein
MPKWEKSALPNEQLLALGLTPEEGFVLSRLSVPMSEMDVVAMTGIEPERTALILSKLAEKGAIRSEASAEDVPAEPPSEGDPSWLEPLEAAETAEKTLPVPDEARAEDQGGGEQTGGEHGAAGEEGEDGDSADPTGSVEDELNYRKVYESVFHPMDPSVRSEAARTEKGANLMALSFDQDPMVIRSLLGNPQFGLAHARLIARHHRSAAGLEVVAQRADLLKDPNLQRRLLANPQVSEAIAKRLLNPKRMADAYKLSINTDFPERTRQMARAILRSKFALAQGEERAGLISATEGRVLSVLTGLTLDARATSILCARSYTSVLFIQNLARFGACPPPLLAHLLKQPMVRRQQHLKNMVLQHPNVPSEAKRNL